MKLSELFLTQEDRDKKAKGKLDDLMSKIKEGEAPEIHAATGVMNGYAWGDLRELGLAKKEEKPAGRNEIEERWVYSADAPGPITLLTKYAKAIPGGDIERGVERTVMNPGDATDWITVDIS